MGSHHRAGLEHKHMQQQLAVEPGCSYCGQRLGKHKYGTDQCPNTKWRPGNGHAQWLTTTYKTAWR